MSQLLNIMGVPMDAGITSANYSPLLLSNLTVWLDFSDNTTLWTTTGRTAHPSNGGTVAYVDNKAGISTYDFQQSSISNRPTLNTNNINGKQVLSFTTDDIIECLNGFTWTGGGFFWMVVKPQTTSSSYQRIFSTRGPVDADFNQNDALIHIWSFDAPNKFVLQFNNAQADNATLISPNGVSSGTAIYSRSYFTGGNATFDNTGMTQVTDTYTNVDITPSWMTVGGQRIALPAYQEFFNGRIGELGIALGPQSAAMLTLHDAYILSKYNLA